MSEDKKVYVVLENDRGCGVMVSAVFDNLEDALEYEKTTCNVYLASEFGHKIESSKNEK